MAITLGAIVQIIGWLATAISVVNNIRAQKKAQQRVEELQNRGHLVNTRTSDAVLPLIYGTCRVGINVVYRGTSGNDNQYLHMIGTVGEGQINGIMTEDGTVFTEVGNAFPSNALVYLDGELLSETGKASYCYFEFFNGSPTQNVCSTLNTALPEWTDPLRRTAYVYIRLRFNRDNMFSIPDFTFVVSGLVCYDPTEHATEHSNNFALHAYDMMTRPSNRGGLGIDSFQSAWDSTKSSPGGKIADPSFELTTAADDDSHWDFSSDENVRWDDDNGYQNTGAARIVNNGASHYLRPNNYFGLDYLLDENNEFIYDESGEPISGPSKLPGYVEASFEDRIYIQVKVRKSPDCNGRLFLGFEEFDSGFNYLTFGAQEITPESTVWETIGIELDTQNENVANVLMIAYVDNSGDAGSFLIDDVYFDTNPPNTRIDISSVEQSRSYCEEKEWTGGLLINEDQDFVDNITLLLNCFRGDIIYSENKFKMKYRDLNYEQIAMELNESDIVINDGQSTLALSPRSDMFSKPNALRASYFNADLNYQKDEFVYDDKDAIDYDGDYREMDITLLGINNLDQLQKMCSYYLEFERWGHTGSFEAGHKTAVLEPGDIIRVSHPLTAWDRQYLRVISIGAGISNKPRINFEEDALNLYDDKYNPASVIRYLATVYNPLADIPFVENITISEQVRATRGRSATWLLVDFDEPPAYPWYRGTKVWMRLGESGAWRSQTTVDSDYEYGPVQEGVEYYFKLQTIGFSGAVTDFDDSPVVSRSVSGMDAEPSNVQDFTVTASGSVVHISATPLQDDDIIGYEIRMGATWQSSTFLIMLLDTPTARVTAITPGWQTFWIAAKNNANLYSSTPSSVTVLIPYPVDFNYQSIWVWEYTIAEGGSFSNTEHTTFDFGDGDGTVDALRCSHTSGLNGTWTSPTIDMGSVKFARVIGDFMSAFIGGTQHWDSVFTSGTVWTNNIPADVSWNYIWRTLYAANFSATLQYGFNSVDEQEFTDFATSYFEGECRYYRLIVHVHDPEASANIYVKEVTITQQTYE